MISIDIIILYRVEFIIILVVRDKELRTGILSLREIGRIVI